MRYIYGKIRFELIIITNTGGTFYQGYLNATRLILALVATLLVSFAGCGLFSSGVENGTEAAKLLLAGERLDEELVGAKLDFGFSDSADTDPTARLVFTGRVAPFGALYADGAAIAPLRGTQSGTPYTWRASDFPATSSSKVEFSQFTQSVEQEAARVAEAARSGEKKE